MIRFNLICSQSPRIRFSPPQALRLGVFLITLYAGLFASTRPLAQERPRGIVGHVEEEVRIDGVLDEGSWGRSTPLGPLTMIEPMEGEPPTAATEIRVMADVRNLYVGIWAYDDNPAEIVSYSKARDSQLRSEDHIKIIVDPFQDGQSGFMFAINPAGARYDALVAG
ncbi:MAG: hypothetical protein QGH61_09230, partial [Candidatus Marinimicrobia bacterium]|nr:hypothetical protein [Candidatus Neomarinimicrobiota bacterium]